MMKPCGTLNWRMRICVGSTALLSLTSYGCAPTPLPSPYRVNLPTLNAAPLVTPCRTDRPTQCVVLTQDDYLALVRELKAACLALGGTPDACLTRKESPP